MLITDTNDFDNYAIDYRLTHTRNISRISGVDSDYFSEYKIKEISGRFDPTESYKILDFGCGDGNSAKYFRKYFPNCDYYGLDISRKSIAQAVKKNVGDDRLHFDYYDGENIPYERDSFDIIFVACVMHHIDKKYHKCMIQQCKKLLKSGGRLIIFEHNPWNPLTVKVVSMCPFDIDAVLMSSNYLRGMLKWAGFKNISVNYTIFMPRKSIFKKLLFLEQYLKGLCIGGQYYVIATKI